MIVDAHLDLAYNAVRGRPVERPAAEQTADHEGIPTVGLPDLRAGGVGLVCATIFCEPSVNGKPGYRDAEEARTAALRQLAWYQQQEAAGTMRFIRDRAGLAGGEDGGLRIEDGRSRVDDGELRIEDGGGRSTGNALPPSHSLSTPSSILHPPSSPSSVSATPSSILHPLSSILLLEGADPLRTAADVPEWHNAGLRIVGLAWRRTRAAGGTGNPGPLTGEGIELVRALDAAAIVHDASHLAEESFWQLLSRSDGPVIASHSNCRAIVPTDRQLSDEMIRAIIERDGVIGINFFDKFLLPPAEYGTRRATLADVVTHVRHVCDLAGDTKHVALGTDMDGGLGREEIPEEIRTSADLPKVADGLRAAGLGADEVRGIMGGNWMGYFQRRLTS